jgi:hypothetical protein
MLRGKLVFILVLLRFQSGRESKARHGSMVGMSCLDFDQFVDEVVEVVKIRSSSKHPPPDRSFAFVAEVFEPSIPRLEGWSDVCGQTHIH